jgi:hypothetical protein
VRGTISVRHCATWDGELFNQWAFSKNRHGHLRDSDLMRRLFETVLVPCIQEGLPAAFDNLL